MKVLIVRQDKLGDCLLTTPLPASIKKARPDCEIDILCQSGFVSLFNRLPDVSSVQATTYRLGLLGIMKTALAWRREKYSAVLLPKEDSGDHTLAAWLAGIPVRVGMTHKRYGKRLTRNFHGSFDSSTHEVRLMLRMAEEALGTSLPECRADLPLTEADLTEAMTMVDGLGEYFVLAPFTGGTSQPWDLEKFRSLGERLCDELGMTAIIVGTAAEQDLADKASAFDGGLNAAGQFSLTGLAALLKGSAFLVSVNSGLIHLAATQQTPACVIETRSDAESASKRWAPWMSPSVTVLPLAGQEPRLEQVHKELMKLIAKTHPDY